MNDLEIRILQYLRANPSGASSTVLSKQCGVSVNTIRRAFSTMFDTMDEDAFYLESKPSAGYRLVVEDEEETDRYFKGLISRSNNPLFEHDSSAEYKANYIIRRLLCSDQYFSISFLADELQYSESSVRRDLKMLEGILERFHLKLVTKKNHGIQIEGNELHKRLCLVFEHKIYVNISPQMQKAEPWFQAVFCIGDQNIRRCRRRIRDAVESHLTLAYKVIDYPPIYNYLPLIRTRKKYDTDYVLTDMQKQYLEKSGMLTEAQRLLKLTEGVLPFDENEIVLYAVVLSIFRSVYDLKQLQPSEKTAMLKNAKECLSEVLDTVSLPYHLSKDILNEFAAVFYMIATRVLFSVPSDSETYRIYQNLNPFSEDMCLAAAAYIQKLTGCPMTFEQCLPMYYFFADWVEQSAMHIFRSKALVVSTYGAQYAQYAAMTVREKYGYFIKQADAAEFTRVNRDMLENYDLLITDLRPEMLPKQYRPVYIYLDAVNTRQKKISRLESYISEFVETEKKKYIFSGTCRAADTEDMLRQISTQIAGDERLTDSLMQRVRMKAPQTKENVLFVSAQDSHVKSGLYCFDIDHETVVDKRLVKQIVCCIYERSDSRAIYIINTLLVQ